MTNRKYLTNKLKEAASRLDRRKVAPLEVCRRTQQGSYLMRMRGASGFNVCAVRRQAQHYSARIIALMPS